MVFVRAGASQRRIEVLDNVGGITLPGEKEPRPRPQHGETCVTGASFAEAHAVA